MSRRIIPGKGTHTPPTPVPMSALHPTRIPVPMTFSTNTGAYDSNQETSSILPKANEVLYRTPNTIYPTQPMSVQYIPKTQFTASQGKNQYYNYYKHYYDTYNSCVPNLLKTATFAIITCIPQHDKHACCDLSFMNVGFFLSQQMFEGCPYIN